MKVTLRAIILSVASAPLLAAEADVYRPVQFDYSDIMDGSVERDPSFLKTLEDVGMISVKNMPANFRDIKKKSLSLLHPCIMESQATKTHEYADGTLRRTIATRTIPWGSMQAMTHGSSAICQDFNKNAAGLRSGVDSLARAFATRLSNSLENTAPLLKTASGYEFRSLKDVVKNGGHLEHFHSYDATSALAPREEDSTIEWHVDQGLLIAFTPGLMIDRDNLEASDHFYVQFADGSRRQVEFDASDDVVFMLGDGVNQYVNRMLSSPRKLRAVPHSVRMSGASKQTRVWFGRMVLPPESALHPVHGKTFGELRNLMIESSTGSKYDKEVMAMGCSSPDMFSRQLEEAACADEPGTMFCWHRCMSLEEHGVSDEICGTLGLDLRCINPRNQLWDNTHGDWYPGCIDAETAELGTPYPQLPSYPRNEDSCTDEAYAAFVEEHSQQYEFAADLLEGGNLMWSVEGENINGMFAFNGLFGYTSLGFRGQPGPGNAMYDALVIMATPSDIYSAATGFDFSSKPTVQEYLIHPSLKAFRHWSTPLVTTTDETTAVVRAGAVDSYDVIETECFTAMTFNTPGIYNRTFNIQGTDELIWGANGVDMFAGYHGQSRGVITVEWATGTVTLDEQREAIKNGPTTEEPSEVTNDASSAVGPSIGLAGLLLPLLV